LGQVTSGIRILIMERMMRKDLARADRRLLDEKTRR
jgi:hypothetical protein